MTPPPSPDGAARALDRLSPLRGARIGVAVSGGADSVAALALFAERGARDGFATIAVHVDHGLRAESAADASLVVALAARLGIPCDVRCVEVAAGRRTRSFEGPARDARYAAFVAVAEERRLTHLVVAHHRDDHVETVVLALLRGGGFAPLAGLRPSRPLTPRCLLVRPFLETSRADLRAAAAGLPIAEDATNLDQALLRNAVRLRLLPRLRAKTPDVELRILELAAAARTIAEAADASAARLRAAEGALCEHGLASAPTAALRAAGRLARARFWLDVVAADPAFGGPASEGILAAIEHAMRTTPSEARPRRELRFAVDADRATLDVDVAWPSVACSTRDVGGADLALDAGGDRHVLVRRLPPHATFDGNASARVYFAAVDEESTIEVRPPKPGDAFRLESGAGRGKVAEALRAAGVEAAWRRRIPTLYIDGELRWIPGVRRVRASEEGAVTLRFELRGAAPWIASS
jgi:tRNA(Ile)-lysidine synthetase-like protein